MSCADGVVDAGLYAAFVDVALLQIVLAMFCRKLTERLTRLERGAAQVKAAKAATVMRVNFMLIEF